MNIKFRRGSASDWTSINPTLASGELAVETDTSKFKIGDGTTAYNSLKYMSIDGGDIGSSQYLYGPDDYSRIIEVDPISKTYNVIYSTGFSNSALNACAYDQNRNQLFFYNSGLNAIYCLDQNNSMTQIQATSLTNEIVALNQYGGIANASYFNNAIWFMADATNYLYKVNLSYSGANQTPSVSNYTKYTISGVNITNNFGDIAINLNTGILYAWTNQAAGGNFYSLNVNGDPSNTYSLIRSSSNVGLQLAFNNDCSVLYGQDFVNGKVYQINTANGNLTDLNFTIGISGPAGMGLRDLSGCRTVPRLRST